MVLDQNTNFFLGKNGLDQKTNFFLERTQKKKHVLGNYTAKLQKDCFFCFS